MLADVSRVVPMSGETSGLEDTAFKLYVAVERIHEFFLRKTNTPNRSTFPSPDGGRVGIGGKKPMEN